MVDFVPSNALSYTPKAVFEACLIDISEIMVSQACLSVAMFFPENVSPAGYYVP